MLNAGDNLEVVVRRIVLYINTFCSQGCNASAKIVDLFRIGDVEDSEALCMLSKLLQIKTVANDIFAVSCGLCFRSQKKVREITITRLSKITEVDFENIISKYRTAERKHLKRKLAEVSKVDNNFVMPKTRVARISLHDMSSRGLSDFKASPEMSSSVVYSTWHFPKSHSHSHSQTQIPLSS
jgi:hypothetical protein